MFSRSVQARSRLDFHFALLYLTSILRTCLYHKTLHNLFTPMLDIIMSRYAPMARCDHFSINPSINTRKLDLSRSMSVAPRVGSSRPDGLSGLVYNSLNDLSTPEHAPPKACHNARVVPHS